MLGKSTLKFDKNGHLMFIIGSHKVKNQTRKLFTTFLHHITAFPSFTTVTNLFH